MIKLPDTIETEKFRQFLHFMIWLGDAGVSSSFYELNNADLWSEYEWASKLELYDLFKKGEIGYD